MSEMFFEASSDALDSITYTFDFVHPLTVSMLSTRREVEKILLLNPKIRDVDISKFFLDSDKVHGVNYKRAFYELEWDKQEETIAWILLNNLFAIYEGWVYRLFVDRFSTLPGYKKDAFTRGLEFEKFSKKINTYYVNSSKISLPMKEAFFNKYKTKCGLDFSKIDNYMLCFRVFKEARNCFMHGNFIASQKLVDAYKAYAPKASIQDLDVKEVPEFYKPVLNKHIKLSLRGVIGFSQIVIRIIRIIDTYLLQTKAGEIEFLSRVPKNLQKRTLNGVKSRAKYQVCRFSTKIGFMDADWSIEYRNFLINNKFFTI